jgi:hypothetical protein
MSIPNQNATVAQGVANANAENNSVKTNEVANAETTNVETSSTIDLASEVMNSIFSENPELFTEESLKPIDTVDWYVPSEKDETIKMVFDKCVEINGNWQILYKVCDIVDEKYVRLPDSVSKLLMGNQTPRASFYTVKSYLSTLRKIASKYDIKWDTIFGMHIKHFMSLDIHKDQEGLVFNEEYKSPLGNVIECPHVWTVNKRAKVEALVESFKELLVNHYAEHRPIMVKVSPRSRNGSAIISSVVA